MPKVTMVEIDKGELIAFQMMIGTREDLAKKLGVAKSVVDRWLSQGRLPQAQLERIKALHVEASAAPNRGVLKTTNMGGAKLFAVGEQPKSVGTAVLNAFKTEELIQELSNRGLDVLVKKPARKPKTGSK